MSQEDKRPHTQILTVANVASRLDCSVRTVWQLISLGRLTAIRIGTRSTRVDEAEVEAFIARARSKSSS